MANKIHSGTLVLNTVAIVTLVDYAARIRVTNREVSSPIWFRVDGTNPTIAGDECYVVLAGKTRDVACSDPNNPEIRMLAAVAAAYTVEGYN